MYAQQSIQDSLFLMLYGGVAILALVTGLYLWLRRSNAVVPDVTPPKALRLWTAAFFITAALSHVWWYVLGVYWLTDDRMVRNIVAVTLDHIAFVPLVMALLLRMLQDRQRPLWPWFLTQVPVLVAAVVGIVSHDGFYGFDVTTYWQIVVMSVFAVYYIYALIQYSRWLRENYADLEHKEVWQSLLLVAVLFVVYEFYFTNPGEMSREYLAQVETLVIVVFLLWRVESLQRLEVEEGQEEITDNLYATIPLNIDISALLEKHCENTGLYLKHDLTLNQLAETIGTNRTYLSQYFALQGITYNAYVNRLRIVHFEQLYRQAMQAQQSVTAQRLANVCGFSSYSTFSTAFKQVEGQNVTSWIRNLTDELQNLQ